MIRVQTDIRKGFAVLAKTSAEMVGSSGAFMTALVALLVWLACGPFFHYSDTWQLIINTATTIVTFLAVFLIQYVQNRDNRTVQLKLDELIHAVNRARNDMIDLDRLTDDELGRLEKRYKEFAQSRSQPANPPRVNTEEL